MTKTACLLLGALATMPWAQAQSLPQTAQPPSVFFEDFHAASWNELAARGWMVRDAKGHPGVPGARWGASQVSLVPQAGGKAWLRLDAQTDGTPEGTAQAQVCQQRKFFRGTYAARVKFSDRPVSGADGDPVVQAFYSVAPLKHDFDPEFSEVDWEYLPNGGWGSAQTRLYGLSWQTVRLDPWLSFNSSREAPGPLAEDAGQDGWHVLVMQVDEQAVRMFIDGRLHAEHRGRNVPVVPMSINFNLWFSPSGLLPAGPVPRQWQQHVDWVVHVKDQQWDAAQVMAQVKAWRASGRHHVDTVEPSGLPTDCSF